jgi:hypothetical protein
MGAAAAVWDVMGLAGVVLALMMVVLTTKRAPAKGAQSRTSQRILAIAKSLSANWQSTSIGGSLLILNYLTQFDRQQPTGKISSSE